jgi:hypothetical protein
MTAILPYHGKCMWEELRFALRSLHANGGGITQLCIVGDKPDWCQPDIFIPMENHGITKEACIANKVIAAFADERVSNDALFLNDDHYILEPMDMTTLPYYKDMTLDQKIGERGFGAYGREMRNTLAFLRDNQLPTFHFDIHVPIRYNREKFTKMYEVVDWSKRPTYIIKSLYANLNLLGGEYLPDPVIRSNDAFVEREGGFLSTTDNVHRSVKEFLYQRFPHKSRWEK